MAIYSVHHSSVGRSTHAAGTAGAHAGYITRAGACRIVLGDHMPIPRAGTKGGPARAWLDEQEEGDRKNARVIDKLMLALPIELDAQARVELVQSFVAELTEGQTPWLAAIHDKGKDEANPHCHLILRDRHVVTGKRALNMSEKGSTERVRELWEKAANAALEKIGSDARIDRRSLPAQREDALAQAYAAKDPAEKLNLFQKAEKLDRSPRGHEGPRAREIARKGRSSDKLDRIHAGRRKNRFGRSASGQAQRAPQKPVEPQTTPRQAEAPKKAVTRPVAAPQGPECTNSKALPLDEQMANEWIAQLPVMEQRLEEARTASVVQAVLDWFWDRIDAARRAFGKDHDLPRLMEADVQEAVRRHPRAMSLIQPGEQPKPQARPSSRSGPSGPSR